MNDHTPRPATSADNGGLLALAAACPMRGELTLCVRREPDFFALNRLQGDRWDVGVVDGGRASVIGCVAIAERLAYVNGVAAPTAYASDLKVHPAFRGRRNGTGDRKSTRLNSSHGYISYAVFCLKKKNTDRETIPSITCVITRIYRGAH